MYGSSLPSARRASSSRWTGDEPRVQQKTTRAPQVVDINLTGLCQLRCAFCWGPQHFRSPVNVDLWAEVLVKLARDGTRRIVYSGGEPLLVKGLRDLLCIGKSLGLKNTLSTNGILLSRNVELLEFVDHLGIPLDGSRPEVQEIMRPRSTMHNGWHAAVEAMRLVQSQGTASLIIRTVVAKANRDDIARIPSVLAAHEVVLRGDRVLYKLYQATHRGEIARAMSQAEWSANWQVAEEEVEAVAAEVRMKFPHLMVTTQISTDADGRYFLAGPDGNVFRDEIGGLALGNIFEDYEACLDACCD